MKNQGVFFHILLVLSIAAVAAMVFFLSPGRALNTPPVLLPSPTDLDGAADEARKKNTYTQIELTPETVQAALATLERIDSYSRTLTVQDFWSGGSRSRSVQVWAHGGALRIAVQSENSEVQEHVLLRGGKKWIWYSDADEVYTGAAAADDADAYQTILTYEKILALPARDILDAGYEDYGGTYCILVRCRLGALGYISECYIDPTTGLLMGERCYDGETLIYAMDSTAPDLSTPDETMLVIPEN